MMGHFGFKMDSLACFLSILEGKWFFRELVPKKELPRILGFISILKNSSILGSAPNRTGHIHSLAEKTKIPIPLSKRKL